MKVQIKAVSATKKQIANAILVFGKKGEEYVSSLEVVAKSKLIESRTVDRILLWLKETDAEAAEAHAATKAGQQLVEKVTDFCKAKAFGDKLTALVKLDAGKGLTPNMKKEKPRPTRASESSLKASDKKHRPWLEEDAPANTASDPKLDKLVESFPKLIVRNNTLNMPYLNRYIDEQMLLITTGFAPISKMFDDKVASSPSLSQGKSTSAFNKVREVLIDEGIKSPKSREAISEIQTLHTFVTKVALEADTLCQSSELLIKGKKASSKEEVEKRLQDLYLQLHEHTPETLMKKTLPVRVRLTSVIATNLIDGLGKAGLKTAIRSWAKGEQGPAPRMVRR